MENLEIYETEIINDDEIDKEYDLGVEEDDDYDIGVEEDDDYDLGEEDGEEEDGEDYCEDNQVIKNLYSDLMSHSFYPSDGVISPMDRYNMYGQAIRCMKCDSLYHVQKDCHIN